MNCIRCKKKISVYINLCPDCGCFLKRELLKEIILIIKKYRQRNDFYGIYEILTRALDITRNTKYEKKIKEQIILTKNKLEEINNKIEHLKNKAAEHCKKQNFKKVLEYHRQILTFQLTRRQQIEIENELLKIKANIYSAEMQDLIDDGQQLFKNI